jgi:molybdopterin-binding protein
VTRVVPAPAYVRVVVDCGFPLVAALTRRSVDDLGLAEGTPVTAAFKASAVHVIRVAGASGPRLITADESGRLA